MLDFFCYPGNVVETVTNYKGHELIKIASLYGIDIHIQNAKLNEALLRVGVDAILAIKVLSKYTFPLIFLTE